MAIFREQRAFGLRSSRKQNYLALPPYAEAYYGIHRCLLWRRITLTGAILGHANARSTAIYAHVQHDPSRRAANRISGKIAEALAGRSEVSAQSEQSDAHEH